MDEQVYRLWKLERTRARGPASFVANDANGYGLSPIQRLVQLYSPQTDFLGECNRSSSRCNFDTFQRRLQLRRTILLETHLVSCHSTLGTRLIVGTA
jgi:hypothetical protein